jgi:hypothetical protein
MIQAGGSITEKLNNVLEAIFRTTSLRSGSLAPYVLRLGEVADLKALHHHSAQIKIR